MSEGSAMKYVAYDYEPTGFWHIYTTDADPDIFDNQGTIIQIKAAETYAMLAAVKTACQALDTVVDAAIQAAAESKSS